MIDNALEILEILNDNGFKAYIIGGAVRDYLLDIDCYDIDITTNAKPVEITKIFNESIISSEYGSVVLKYKKLNVEITTFRKEIKYIGNRFPEEIVYIDNLEDDLERRDITINTICMDKDKNIIDILNGRTDIKNKLIRVVGDPYIKLENDALRILRCIRFATKLNFRLDTKCMDAIKKNAPLLKNLSYERKKEELDKIFASKNIKYGVKLIRKLGIDKYLDLNNINKVKIVNDIVAMWSQFDVLNIYPFNKNIAEQIKKLNYLKDKNLYDSYIVYLYGSYLCTLSAKIRGLNENKILNIYDNLPIYNRNEINMTGEDLIKVMDKEPSTWVSEILKDIEKKIIYKELDNDYNKIKDYIVNKYKE